RLAEADWSGHLVDTNDRYEQGLERDPPFGKRPPGELSEHHGRAALRYKAQPPGAGYDRRHVRMATGPPQAVAQADHAQPRQQQRPGPQLGQVADLEPGARHGEEAYVLDE